MRYVPPDFAALTTPRDVSEWHDDDGDVLWWLLLDGHTVSEPPEVGSPLVVDWYYDQYLDGDNRFHNPKYPEARLVWTPLPHIARYDAPAGAAKEE